MVVTFAVLETIVPAASEDSTRTVRVKVALPTPRVPIEQETVTPSGVKGSGGKGVEHDQPAGRDSPANLMVLNGNVSDQETLSAGTGPELVTVIVYWR